MAERNDSGGRSKSGLSFAFSKKIDNKKLQKSAVSEDLALEVKAKDFVLSVEGREVKSSKPKESAKQYVIPLIKENNWRTIPTTNSDTNKADMDDMAVQEVLKDVIKLNEDWDERCADKIDGNLKVPLLLQNKVPEGYESEDKLDVSLRPDAPDTVDYDEIPIDHFGKAMLRGMGWEEGKGIGKNMKDVAPYEAIMRPKGLGLGADKNQNLKENGQKNKATDDEKGEAELDIKTGAYCTFLKGTNKGFYGIIQGLDEDNARVMVKLAVSGKVDTLSQYLIKVVTKKEYEKYSKYINKAKVDKYKEVEKKKEESRSSESDESSNDSRSQSSSANRSDSSTRKRSNSKSPNLKRSSSRSSTHSVSKRSRHCARKNKSRSGSKSTSPSCKRKSGSVIKKSRSVSKERSVSKKQSRSVSKKQSRSVSKERSRSVSKKRSRSVSKKRRSVSKKRSRSVSKERSRSVSKKQRSVSKEISRSASKKRSSVSNKRSRSVSKKRSSVSKKSRKRSSRSYSRKRSRSDSGSRSDSRRRSRSGSRKRSHRSRRSKSYSRSRSHGRERRSRSHGRDRRSRSPGQYRRSRSPCSRYFNNYNRYNNYNRNNSYNYNNYRNYRQPYNPYYDNRRRNQYDYEERRYDKDYRSSDRNVRERKRSTDKSEEKSQTCGGSWVRSNMKVRIIDNNLFDGLHFKEKVVVIDVVEKDNIMCKTDSGKTLEKIPESALETVIPKSTPHVIILFGRHKGLIGEVIKRDKERGSAMLELLKDRGTMVNLDYDSICEYVGEIDSEYYF